MIVTWHYDEASNRAYALLRAEMLPIVQRLFPLYELSHVGFVRNFDTGEVKITLHINELGRVKLTQSEPLITYEKEQS